LCFDIEPDPAGGAAIVGTFRNQLELGTTTLSAVGGRDAFVVALDAQGRVVWATSFGGAGEDRAHALAIGPAGQIAVVGSFTDEAKFGATTLRGTGESAFVALLDSTGSVRHAIHLDASNPGAAEVWGVAVDETGNTYVAGQLEEALSIAGGPLLRGQGQGVLFVKLDPAGKHVLSGRTVSGGMISAWSAAATPDGGMVVAGAADRLGTPPSKAGGTDIVGVFFDRKGRQRHVARFGSPGSDWGKRVAVDARGNVVLAGDLGGVGALLGRATGKPSREAGLVVALHAPSYKPVWGMTIASSETTEIGGLASSPTGEVAVSGIFKGELVLGAARLSAAKQDVYVASLDRDGDVRWAVRIGGALDDDNRALAMDRHGNVLICGSVQKAAELGKQRLPAGPGASLFVSKLAR